MSKQRNTIREEVRQALAAREQTPTAAQLAQELGLTAAQVRAAVNGLRARGSEVMIAPEGRPATAVTRQGQLLTQRLQDVHAFITGQNPPPTAARVAERFGVKQNRPYGYLRELRQYGIELQLTPMPRGAHATADYQRRQATGELTPRQAQVLAYLREAAARGERPTGPNIAEALAMTRTKVGEILGALRERGLAKLFPPRDGWAPTEAATAVAGPAWRPLTLLALQDLVDRSVATDPVAAGLVTKRGHLTLEERDQRRAVTRSQQTDARTGVNALADLLHIDRDQPLPPWLTSWDGTDWACIARLEKAYNERAEVKHLGPSPFSSRDVASGRGKVLGGVRIALDLAVNHSLISRAAAKRPTSGIATPYLEVLPDWVRRVAELGKVPSDDATNGCRVLARYATELGAEMPAAADWRRVRERIVADARDGKLVGARGAVTRAHSTLHDARRAYLALEELVLGGGPWPTELEERSSQRRALVCTAAISAAAEKRDWSGWTLDDGHRLGGLLDGPYGLVTYVTWATADNLELAGQNLPPRAYPGSDGKPGKVARCKVGVETLRSKLTRIATFCGWSARHAGSNWSQDNVLALLDPRLTLLTGYRKWLVDEGFLPRAQLASLAMDLSVLASPFGEAQALRAGDVKLAAYLRESHAALRRYANELKPTLDEQKKQIARIARAWSRHGRPGLLRLHDLKELLVQEAERIAGMTKAEQIAALEAGRKDWQSHGWAIAIRDAFAINLVRRLPMRERALRGLATNPRADNRPSKEQRFGWWEQELPAGWPAGRPLAPWEGGIVVQVPMSLTKGSRDYEPALVAAEHCAPCNATPAERLAYAAEVEVDRELMQLDLAPDGARDQLMPPPVPTKKDRNPPHWLLITGRGKRFGRNALSRVFKRLILRYGPALGLDVEDLKAMHGATGIHIVRCLFGTYWAPTNLRFAQLMLQHKSPETTSKLYDGSTERDQRVLVPVHLLRGSAPVEPELERLQRQNAELLEQVGRLTALLERRVAAA